MAKRTQEEVEEIVNDMGYVLLEEYTGKNYKKELLFKMLTGINGTDFLII